MTQTLSAPPQPSRLQTELDDLVNITQHVGTIKEPLLLLEGRLNGISKTSGGPSIEKQVPPDRSRGFIPESCALLDQLKKHLVEMDTMVESLQLSI